MGGGCHVNPWVRPFRGRGGEVGIPRSSSSSETLFFNVLEARQEMDSSNSLKLKLSSQRVYFIHVIYFEAPPLGSFMPRSFVSLYLGAPEVSDEGGRTLTHQDCYEFTSTIQ